MYAIRWIDAVRTGRLGATGLSVIGTLSLLLPGVAHASNFRVSPVTLTVPANRPIGSLTITNSDSAPVSIKVATYRWTQVGGQDVYTPTDDLIASPPIFTTAAGAVQLIRVGVRRKVATAAYRVVLEEIPAAAKTGVAIALNLNMPLYVVANAAAKATVQWTARRTADATILLEGHNSGDAPQQVLAIGLPGTGAGAPAILSSAMGVVLPASMRQWNIGKHPDWAPGLPLHLTIRTATGVNEVTANLSAG
jgi:fimbrial chaperone protein